MTAPATTRRAGPFTGNGVTTSFPFTFKVFAATDIAVLKNSGGADVTLSSGAYSVTLNPDQDATPGGSVTYTALGIGETLVIIGALPYDQTADLPTGGNYRAGVIENALDRTVFQIQQLVEQSERTLTLPATGAGADTELPAPEAGAVIGWNSTANGLINIDPTTLASIVAYANRRTLVANGGVASYTLAADPGNASNTMVAVSGVVQTPGVDYTVSGTTLTPTTPWPAGTGNVVIVYGEALPVGTLAISDSVSAPRFVGTNTDDAGTPDATFRVLRTLGSLLIGGGHAFRDETLVTGSVAASGYNCFDAAQTINATGMDHTVGFQARPIINGSMTHVYGATDAPTFGSGASVVNRYGLYVFNPVGAGAPEYNYGFYVALQSKGSVKNYSGYIAQQGAEFFCGAPLFVNNTVKVGTAPMYLGGSSPTGFPQWGYNYEPVSGTYATADVAMSCLLDSTGYRFRSAAAGSAGAACTLSDLFQVKLNGGVRFMPRAAAPSVPQAGEVYFDSGLSKLRCWDGAAWQNLW